MVLAFAAPYAAPSPARSWIGLQMTWTGWDGSVWDLTSAAEGVVMMAGVRGLTMPPVVHYKTSYATVPGANWRGHTVDPREVFWPIQVFSDNGSQAWVERERAFWKTMRPVKTGVWSVTHPSGEQRHLDCRFVDDGQQAFSIDPAIVGWSNYGITMVADKPFWRGTPQGREWAAGGALPFFHEAAPGASFTISPSNAAGTAHMHNPGDVDTYPVWELTGPIDSASVGIPGRTIGVPFAIAAGKILIIETDPTKQVATLYDHTGSGATRVLTNPVDKTTNLTAPVFAALPADENATLAVTMAGTGNVRAVITPLYLRAW
jgi:hypothetical protein